MYDNAFDTYVSASTVASTYAASCGATNHKAGLSMGYLDPMSEGVSSIPFGVRTEIPVTFTTNGYCNTFNNVNLMLIASCEIPTPNSRVQQYATVPNTVPVQINYNNYTYAQNWTVPFSVSWAASRRLSEEEEEGHSISQTTVTNELLLAKMDKMTTKIDVQKDEILEIMQKELKILRSEILDALKQLSK